MTTTRKVMLTIGIIFIAWLLVFAFMLTQMAGTLHDVVTTL